MTTARWAVLRGIRAHPRQSCNGREPRRARASAPPSSTTNRLRRLHSLRERAVH
jgi:hypothetical protein